MTSLPPASGFDWNNLAARAVSGLVLAGVARAVWVFDWPGPPWRAPFLILAAVRRRAACPSSGRQWPRRRPARRRVATRRRGRGDSSCLRRPGWRRLALRRWSGRSPPRLAGASRRGPSTRPTACFTSLRRAWRWSGSGSMQGRRLDPDAVCDHLGGGHLAPFLVGNVWRAQLWPRFSPNKTWSGFVGGLVGAVPRGRRGGAFDALSLVGAAIDRDWRGPGDHGGRSLGVDVEAKVWRKDSGRPDSRPWRPAGSGGRTDVRGPGLRRGAAGGPLRLGALMGSRRVVILGSTGSVGPLHPRSARAGRRTRRDAGPHASGPNAGNVVLWMQPDGTLHPSAIPVETPNPSDSDASYWLARTLWALGEGYADFRGADPAFAGFLHQRMDLAVAALQREVLSRYGQFQLSNGLRMPAWLIVGGADASSRPCSAWPPMSPRAVPPPPAAHYPNWLTASPP